MTTEWPIGHGVWDTGLRGNVRLVPLFLSGRLSDPEIFVAVTDPVVAALWAVFGLRDLRT